MNMIKTLVLISNYFNHHQKAFCDEMYTHLGEGFKFVETMPMEDFRSKMGWGKEEIPPYVLKTHLGEENDRLAYELAEKADVVIMGTAPEGYVKKRLDLDRLTFRLSERALKEGRWKIFVPYLAKKFYINHISRKKNKSLYCLCAGAFVASDFEFLLGSYRDRCSKFGYFPYPEALSWEELTAQKRQNNKTRILWCGRFLKLKRADLLIKAAAAAKDKGYDFELEIVGSGEEEKNIRALVKDMGLMDRTVFPGYLSPEDTRHEMEKADIYVCTSNKLEGWGAVIYEGLSAGCATIATSMAGATPFLIKDGVTGYIYRSGDAGSLADRLLKLLEDPDGARGMGRRAYEQMRDSWNPAEAAARVLDVSDHLLKGEEYFYEDGPLSKAPVLYEDWYRG
ncbi:MAG: glycosyltransferase family 4 protein, partial [Lachnospiraceae bacterium]|nr:glycosyltransferase family 4 protein [Lachnospiraceae bacterium]